MTSASARLLRNGEIDQQDFRLALARLTELRRRWIEVQPTAVLHELALRRQNSQMPEKPLLVFGSVFGGGRRSWCR
jgi:hypothetical protein